MSFQNRGTRCLESLTAQRDSLSRSFLTVGNDEYNIHVISLVILEPRNEVSGLSYGTARLLVAFVLHCRE
ncbi:hypothetical protein VCHA48P434_70189 [Vibrio chagasii]|nr:hypothetical protein VCHA48P434_70189 [Vibrio chagasii]